MDKNEKSAPIIKYTIPPDGWFSINGGFPIQVKGVHFSCNATLYVEDYGDSLQILRHCYPEVLSGTIKEKIVSTTAAILALGNNVEGLEESRLARRLEELKAYLRGMIENG